MKIIPLTPAQRDFLLVDVLDAYLDDDNPSLRETAQVAADHVRRAHGGGLPLHNPELLYDMVLEATNAIDDAVEDGQSERRYSLTPRQARSLVRTGTAIMRKLSAYREHQANADRGAKAKAEAAVQSMRRYLGAVDHASVRAQQRFYTQVMRDLGRVAQHYGVEAAEVWDTVETEARRRGVLRSMPGQHY